MEWLKKFSIELSKETSYTSYMMNNEETIQATAKHIATSLQLGGGEVNLPEHIQFLLNYTVDQRSQHPYAAAIADATLQYLFEALEPEQVIL